MSGAKQAVHFAVSNGNLCGDFIVISCRPQNALRGLLFSWVVAHLAWSELDFRKLLMLGSQGCRRNQGIAYCSGACVYELFCFHCLMGKWSVSWKPHMDIWISRNSHDILEAQTCPDLAATTGCAWLSLPSESHGGHKTQVCEWGQRQGKKFEGCCWGGALGPSVCVGGTAFKADPDMATRTLTTFEPFEHTRSVLVCGVFDFCCIGMRKTFCLVVASISTSWRHWKRRPDQEFNSRYQKLGWVTLTQDDLLQFASWIDTSFPEAESWGAQFLF